MTLKLFTGGAGTGKSTQLIAAVEGERVHLVDDSQRVLALTKYHGSRKRMEERFRQDPRTRKIIECRTIDSFAWYLVRRWKSIIRDAGTNVDIDNFAEVALTASQILQEDRVARWVARKYPVVVVDEFQDCSQGTLGIVRALFPHTRILCAADGFQDLSGAASNTALLWAEEVGEKSELTHCHRTDDPTVTSFATLLREGGSLASLSKSIKPAASFSHAGAIGCWKLFSWAKIPNSTVAIISPVRPCRSQFVSGTVEWLSENQASSKFGGKAGPFPTRWEQSDGDHSEYLLSKLDVPEIDEGALSLEQIETSARLIDADGLSLWCRRVRSIQGRTVVSRDELVQAVNQVARNHRIFSRNATRRVATTIHQAKNREFDFVLVLWPREIKKDPEKQRRLLYNAVTRARKNVCVVVQDPRKQRIKHPPFEP